MPRPFIEFIQSQDMPWSPTGDQGHLEKRLASDPDNGASTRLIRLPATGSSLHRVAGMALEIFVLEGAIDIEQNRMGLHHYAYLPASDSDLPIRSAGGATVLVFEDVASPKIGDPSVLIDSVAQPWDRSGLEEEISHLNYARKNLRLAPDGSCRTYLLGGMPHGLPHDGARLERHPHAEEMFMISGDMPCSLGIMKAGAYFHRPPLVWHGLDCTLGGFLILMRTPGSNLTVSEWSETLHPVHFFPDHAPEVPVGHPAHASLGHKLTVEY